MWIRPDSESPQASLPSDVITILATILSGSFIPRRIARFRESEMSKVDEFGGGAGFAVGTELNALYSVFPSGEKTLPPTLVAVAKVPVIGNGALAVFCCASTFNEAMSYNVNPAIKPAPVGAIESEVD